MLLYVMYVRFLQISKLHYPSTCGPENVFLACVRKVSTDFGAQLFVYLRSGKYGLTLCTQGFYKFGSSIIHLRAVRKMRVLAYACKVSTDLQNQSFVHLRSGKCSFTLCT